MSFAGFWLMTSGKKVALGGLVVACLPLDPRFAGSNPAGDDGFTLRSMKQMLRRQNSAAMFLTHVSPASLLDGSSRRIRIE
jgi:hypothetical protein